MKFRVCSDVGGTFSDLFVFDEDTGDWSVFKHSTEQDNTAENIIDTLMLASEYYRMSLKEFLSECVSIVHGSTVGTNTLIEGRTAKVGLICTKGFRDILTLRESGKINPFLWRIDNPEPFVPRYLTFTVAERINSEGQIEVPLDEDEVIGMARQLKKHEVHAIAICFLWSIVNPLHEQRAAAIIKKEMPGIPTVISSELNPIIREYRRASSTVINASLLNVVQTYIEDIEETLKEAGYSRPLSLATCSGGIVSTNEMIRKPIYSINSGPSMAPIAGRELALMERGSNNVLIVDMGGTSFDVSIVSDGKVALSREVTLEGYFPGINMIDSRNIGAGGGSIAWVDSGRLVHVGPKSAGAIPGPAFYGRGGMQPTVADADLVLGYLDPDYFLGGKIKLDPGLSRHVVDDVIAKPLGLDVSEAAFTIWSVVNHNMIAAMQGMMVQHGIDPRTYVLVSGGGAAGMHIHPIAKELKVNKVLIPKIAGVLSSYGGAFADIVSDFSASYFTESSAFNYDAVNAVLVELDKQAEDFFSRHDVAHDKRRIDFYVEARYPKQIWELEVPLRSGRIKGDSDLGQLVNDFHDTHERMYAIREPGQHIEFVHWGVHAVGFTPKPKMKELPYGGKNTPATSLKGSRTAFFKKLGGFVETNVFDGIELMYGNSINGPAIIEETTTTIVVFPDSTISVTRYGNYLMKLK